MVVMYIYTHPYVFTHVICRNEKVRERDRERDRERERERERDPSSFKEWAGAGPCLPTKRMLSQATEPENSDPKTLSPMTKLLGRRELRVRGVMVHGYSLGPCAGRHLHRLFFEVRSGPHKYVPPGRRRRILSV